jgi:adenine-specific DNA-methyltransferase
MDSRIADWCARRRVKKKWNGSNMATKFTIRARYSPKNHLTIRAADCVRFLGSLPSGSTQLVLTSPPYNVGKSYECSQSLDGYVAFQKQVLAESVRILRPGGSICWQLGSHVRKDGEVVPLDLLLYPLFQAHPHLKLRNRIIWHFEHGEHCQRRLSGRYECILWFTFGDNYLFNLDAVRVPQKYPGKLAYRGPNRGKPSGNPKGKNPGDVWLIPNVKGNHVEKTIHPCQFPIALAEQCILALSNRRQLVVDPFLGAGTTAVAALKNGRRAAGCDKIGDFVDLTIRRVRLLEGGRLPYRNRNRPIYVPLPNTPLTTPPKQFVVANGHA